MEETKKEAPTTEEKQEEPAESIEEELKEEELEEKTEDTETTEEKEEEQAPSEEAKTEEAKTEEILAPAEEEEVKPPEKEKKAEEEIVEERTYTVPLGKALIVPPNKRAARAMRMLRSFIIKHMKLEAHKEGAAPEEEEEPAKLIITNEVNQKIWERGIEKPPRKIRVRAAKDKEGNVTVYLAEGD